MSRISRIENILLLTCLGGVNVFVIYLTSKSSFLFVYALLLLTGGLFCTALAFIIREEIKVFSLSKKYVNFLASFIGSLIIAFNAGWYIYLQRPFHVSTLVSAFYDGGFNGFGMDFKTDGTYIMSNSGGLGLFYFYGTYTINDSIITLDKSNIDNCIMTNRLVIRPIVSIYDQGVEDYIIQIDASGKEMKNESRLRVTRDNRILSR